MIESWRKWPDGRIEAYIRKHEDTDNEEMIDRIAHMERELELRQAEYEPMGDPFYEGMGHEMPDSPSLQDYGIELGSYES